MSRFDSPLRVASLFFAAACVSVGLIFFINAEAQSRLDTLHHQLQSTTIRAEQHNGFPDEPPDGPIQEPKTKSEGAQLYKVLENGVLKILQGVKATLVHNSNPMSEPSRSLKRKRRSSKDKQDPFAFSEQTHDNNNNHHFLGLENDEDVQMGPRSPKESHQEKSSSGSSIDYHRIRHAMKKLGGGGLDLSVMERMILDPNPGGHRQPPNSPRDSEKDPSNSRKNQGKNAGKKTEKKLNHGRPVPNINPGYPNPNHGDNPSYPNHGDNPSYPNHGDNERKGKDVPIGNDAYNYEHHHALAHQRTVLSLQEESFEDSNSPAVVREVEKDEEGNWILDPPNNGRNSPGEEGKKIETTTWFIAEEDLAGRVITMIIPGKNETTRFDSPAHNKEKIHHVGESLEPCYSRDDVLVVVGLTCTLNFAFVLLIYGFVRWFNVSGTSKEKDFHQLDCEGGDSFVYQQDTDEWGTERRISREIMRKDRGMKEFSSSSLYTFRPEFVPHPLIRRSLSHSMENLKFTHT